MSRSAAAGDDGPSPDAITATAALSSSSSSAGANQATIRAHPGHTQHQSISSLSPRANQALSDPDYWPDRDGEDDVFSNPDTAELETRSDATGATSPDRATSPALQGSPERGLLSLPSDWDEQQQQDGKWEQPPVLQHQPSLTSQLTALARTGDHGGDTSTDNVTPTPSMLRGAQGRHRFDGMLKLPAANDLPLDPAKASDISSLFAHPPAPAPTSPVASSIRAALSPAVSATTSPVSERRGFQWTMPVAPPAARSVPRPTSPERQRTIVPAALRPGSSSSTSASPLVGSGSLGLGLASVAGTQQDGVASNASASESSIFERDIEHRDARHVLSKSEAVDVAIPPVLDDAVEAIIEGGEEPIEIVTPLSSAAPAPLPLSATALSASTQSLSSFSSPSSSGPQSPISSTGPVLSSAAVDEPPPGSIAAQIAERLAPSRSATDEAALSSSPPKNSVTRTPRHRQTQSSSASSVGSSTRSRSPSRMAPMGVQQVLDSSAAAAGKSSTEPSSPVRASSPRAFRPSSVASGAVGAAATPSKAGTTAGAPITPSSHQGAGTALPSLPLPNPFRSDVPSALRSHSPSASISMGSSDAAPPAPISMSLDGAIIPSSESAVRELSLDGMADAIAEADGSLSSPSPILARKGLPSTAASPAPPTTAAFVRRDTAATITLDNKSEAVMEEAAPATRRLSFFSYANILNDTPAVLVDLEQSVQRTMDDTSGATAAARSTVGSGSSRPSTSISSGSSVLGDKSMMVDSIRSSRRASGVPTSQQISPTLAGGRIVGSPTAASSAVKASSPLTAESHQQP